MNGPPSSLRPPNPEDVTAALSRGLLYEGTRRVHHADRVMARVAAERLVEQLEASGFVVMKQAGAEAPSTSGMPPPHTG